ncbi:hypothetical protein BCR35DRAFT_299131 [Leucosporidium creatinivorum]|uniref:Uncharacterized protein n=1 Tax=Leucosporidium creatinivorum TaxID=106004 RepID=A0A1Y2G325_9BASI|nr:hypothetical protein BCR35DRAFT_299131 [Leucosporidium creatinivorum]
MVDRTAGKLLLSYRDPPYLSPPARDHLSTLPNEILSYIFHLISQHRVSRFHPSTSLPISKALLPFTRARLYRHVNLASLKNIQRFARTLKERPSLGPLVEELRIDAVAEEAEKLVDEEMYDLFAALDQLRVLVVACQKVARLVLTEWFMATFCPVLEILSFDGREALHDFPHTPFRAFTPIDLHPSLHSLRISAQGVDSAMQHHLAGAILPPPSWIGAIKELYLEGALELVPYYEISHLFDKLEHLHLTYISSVWEWVDAAFSLLLNLPCSNTLTHLTLRVPPDDEMLLSEIDVPLLDFPNLLHLTWDMNLGLPSTFNLPRLRVLVLGAEYQGDYLAKDINTKILDPQTKGKQLGALELLDVSQVDLSLFLTTGGARTLRGAAGAIRSSNGWHSPRVEGILSCCVGEAKHERESVAELRVRLPAMKFLILLQQVCPRVEMYGELRRLSCSESLSRAKGRLTPKSTCEVSLPLAILSLGFKALSRSSPRLGTYREPS